MRYWSCVLFLLLVWPFCGLFADETAEEPLPLRTEQLLEIQSALSSAEAELKALKKASAKTTEQQDPGLFAELRKQNESVEKLQQSLEKTATDGLIIAAIDIAEPPFDWRAEMAAVTQPIIESLKKLTNKPRQTARLEAAIERINTQQVTVEKGLAKIGQELAAVDNAALKTSLQTLQKNWQQELANLNREKSVNEAQLQTLENDKSGWWASLRYSLEGFFAGRALTLLLAIVMAVGVWLMFRILNRHLWRYHSARRGSPLYRFFMYSFHAFSTVFMVLVVFMVFYLRDDVLL
ncbi:MAG: coiled-coil domain-containing protein, partial [Thiolinea sp.]